MSRIRIRRDTVEADRDYPYANAMNGFGTEIELDGKPLTGVRDISLHVGLDEPTTAKVELIAEKSLDVELDAVAQITFIVIDDRLVIEDTPLPNGGRRIKAVLA